MKRRQFIQSLAGLALTGLVQEAAQAFNQVTVTRYLRPPGAIRDDDRFASTCIGCSQCAQVCPNDCIRFFGVSDGIKQANTPFIEPRKKACILCMKCGEVCPSGAIKRIRRTAKEILGKVKMGHARVDKTLCLSYQGKTCGVCYRACPLQDVAIKTGLLETPIVTKACVGCGICERSCIQMPQAIKVIPARMLG